MSETFPNWAKILLAKTFALLLLLSFFILLTLSGHPSAGGIVFIGFWLLAALFARLNEQMRPFSYPLVIFGAITSSMYFPWLYRSWYGFDTLKTITPILQVLMFGMGTQLGLKDFRQVAVQPWGVFIGVGAQFLIMPLVGWTLAHAFPFDPQIGVGIILIGCVPCGIASNVMNFLARANVALSVTLAAVGTLVGPIFTPLWMHVLAGQTVTMNSWAMSISMINIVIVPIILGILFRMLILSYLGERFHTWFKNSLGFFSMIGLLLTFVFINANARDALLTIGPLLILTCLIHNLSGYFLGYWLAKLCRLDEKSCKTVSIEVGMQNGGLASTLAVSMGTLVTLAPAVFGPLMNVTGATLAIFWGKRAEKEELAERIK